jgi:hypothetical protein
MAGRLRLAAIGIQDQWLSDEPQFSYFLMNFKRHTKFSVDVLENQFDGTVDFGNVIECRIPIDKGDLIKNMTLKVTLNDPTPDETGNDTIWSPSIITHMIEYAELLIGGQVIEKITGEYIYLYQQLHNTNDDIDQTLYFLNGHGNILSYQGDYTYFLNLPFYFYRNPTLAIPTCALTKHIVEVKLKLRPLKEVIFNSGLPVGAPYDIPDGVQGSIRTMSIDADFVYLSEEERQYLMSYPIDYVITQVQLAQFKMKVGETKRSVMLNFQHPVKELFFVSQSEEAVEDNDPNWYNSIKNVELRFNNEVVFNRDTKFLVYEQSLKHHINSPSSANIATFGMYSFSLKPEVYYPTGQVNMSRITHKMLTVEIIPNNYAEANKTRIYAINYNVLRFESGLAGLKF